jgi:hypothetical protein
MEDAGVTQMSNAGMWFIQNIQFIIGLSAAEPIVTAQRWRPGRDIAESRLSAKLTTQHNNGMAVKVIESSLLNQLPILDLTL